MDYEFNKIGDNMEFEISCEICENITQVFTEDDDEMPSFCPMCGSPVEVEEA